MDGPLAGQVLMLSKPTDVGSLWTVNGPDGSAYTYRYAGNHFAFVGPDMDAPLMDAG